MKILGFGLAATLLVGCQPGARDEQLAKSGAALAIEGATTTLAWGSAPGAIGLSAAVTERAALGAPAVAVSPDGVVLVLDAQNERIVRLSGRGAVPVANVPKDADDIAVGPDGAFAVRRSVKPEVLVFAPNGASIGAVDTSAIESVDTIALGLSRRVVVTTPFQETFTIGSPAVPQLAAQIRAGKREGAAFLEGGRGVVAVRRSDGELELRVIDPAAAQGERVVARHALGKGASARVVGASGAAVCLRIEHLSEGQGGAVQVEREAACLDATTGRTLLRTRLPAPGTYLPRRELAFAGRTLAFAHASDEGLAITTWTLEGGVR
jgi:hypothetical protein